MITLKWYLIAGASVVGFCLMSVLACHFIENVIFSESGQNKEGEMPEKTYRNTDVVSLNLSTVEEVGEVYRRISYRDEVFAFLVRMASGEQIEFASIASEDAESRRADLLDALADIGWLWPKRESDDGIKKEGGE